MCPDQWLAILVFLLAVVGPWLGGGRSNNGAFYAVYQRAVKDSGCAVPPYMFGVVWFILYTLMIVSFSVLYYHDETCKCAVLRDASTSDYSDSTEPGEGDWVSTECVAPRVSAAVMNWTWAIVIANIFITKLWDVLSSRAKQSYASFAVVQVVASLATGAALLILFAEVASKTSGTVYIGVVAYALYCLWLVIALFLAVRVSSKFTDSADELVAEGVLQKAGDEFVLSKRRE